MHASGSSTGTVPYRYIVPPAMPGDPPPPPGPHRAAPAAGRQHPHGRAPGQQLPVGQHRGPVAQPRGAHQRVPSHVVKHVQHLGEGRGGGVRGWWWCMYVRTVSTLRKQTRGANSWRQVNQGNAAQGWCRRGDQPVPVAPACTCLRQRTHAPASAYRLRMESPLVPPSQAARTDACPSCCLRQRHRQKRHPRQ